MKSATAQKVEALIAPAVADLGYVLWGVVFLSGDGTLRVYIEHENGIALEDCERVSREVAAILDVEDPIKQAYSLEVSSPGMDRPLFTGDQFAAHAGEQVKITMSRPVDGRRKFDGQIVSAADEMAVVSVDGQEYELPIAGMAKSRVVPQW